jgi:hypothetical protein
MDFELGEEGDKLKLEFTGTEDELEEYRKRVKELEAGDPKELDKIIADLKGLRDVPVQDITDELFKRNEMRRILGIPLLPNPGDYEAASKYARHLEDNLGEARDFVVEADRRLKIVSDCKDWTQALLETVEHRIERPELEWEDVPRLLHQLQYFFADSQRPVTLLNGWADKPEVFGRRSSPRIRKAIRNGYERAAEIWVSSDITKTIIHAADSFPDTWHLEPSDVTFAEGFAVLQDQFAGEDWHGQNMCLSAIMWHPYIIDDQPGVLCWLHAYVDHKVKNFPALYPGWPQWIPFGATEDTDPVRKLCAAFLLMIGQPLVAQERNEPTGKKKAKRNSKPVKSVISLVLRRTKHEHSAQDKEGEGARVDWQYRWIVNAHWRNQWYPSEKRHRTILIGSFVKGPEDKPLKVTEKVYKWIR